MFHLWSGEWLQNISDIKPGASAILSGNKMTHYTIHFAGIFIAFISFTSSIFVIVHILVTNCRESSSIPRLERRPSIVSNNNHTTRWDFSDRFPLYIALADASWSFINLSGDHVVLLISGTFPEKFVGTWLAIVLSFFIGYQHLTSGFLALYTYLKVVKRNPIDFGKGEWKVHVFIVTYLLVFTAVFYPMDAYGCSGYWFITNFQTWGGVLFQLVLAFSGTILSICMLFSYIQIRKEVLKQHKVLQRLSAFEHCGETVHDTAVKCLSTFIYISILLYLPITMLMWIIYFFALYNKLEPFSVFAAVVMTNSCGWVNTYAYFHNKRVKENRRRECLFVKLRNLNQKKMSEINISEHFYYKNPEKK